MCEHKAVDFDISSGTWVCRKCGIAVGMAGMMTSIAHCEVDPVKEAGFTGTIIAQQIKPEEDIEQLIACRAALRDCVEALEVAQGYVESSGWTRHRDAEIAQIEAAITNARKILKE